MTYRVPLVIVLILLIMLGAVRAHGQVPVAGDLATADALFLDGRRLSAQSRFVEACARFEASMALFPRLGVALNLADCYEHLGRTASAWVAFGEAAALARRLVDSREAYALQRRDALDPRLSRLRITLAGAAVDGQVVTRDGVRVDPAAYGVEVPVDPGAHVVQATAPGRRPWSVQTAVSGEGEVAAVEVPELERVPVSVGVLTAARVSSTPEPGQRRATPAMWITLGVSAAGFGAGTAFGLAARSLWQQARSDCDPSNHCSDAGYALVARSRRDGDLSTGAFAVAGAALVVSAILLARASRRSDPPVRIVAELAPGTAGAVLVGEF